MRFAKASLPCALTFFACGFGHTMATAQRAAPPSGLPRSVRVISSSRRSIDPATPAQLAEVSRNANDALQGSKYFTPASDPAKADLVAELEFEPHFRYGQFHYQNGPFVFLTLRDVQSGRLLYCAYSRNGRFRDVTRHLIAEMDHHIGDAQTTSLVACAEAAMRPLKEPAQP